MTAHTLRFGSLFSGIGGIDLGLEWAGMIPAWMCERDKHCRGWLRSNWPGVPLYDDITTINPAGLAHVDLICGGFPCQPVSLAGRRQGANDARWLWPVMRDIVSCVRPAWVLGENTPGLITMGLDGVLSDLEALGYTCRTFVIPACAVDAPHRRDRVFIVAHSGRGGFDQGGASVPGKAGGETLAGDGSKGHVADAPVSRGLSEGRTGTEDAQRERSAGWSCGCGPMVHPTSLGRREGRPEPSVRCGRDSASCAGGTGSDVGNSDSMWTPQPKGGVGEFRGRAEHASQGHWDESEWITANDKKARRIKPGIRMLAYGVPGRVARLKALGNAVVPQVAYEIGRAIVAAHTGQPAPAPLLEVL